jgi:hypothetical protein
VGYLQIDREQTCEDVVISTGGLPKLQSERAQLSEPIWHVDSKQSEGDNMTSKIEDPTPPAVADGDTPPANTLD